MPGPASDSYHPEFGTMSNAIAVEEALSAVRIKVTKLIGNIDSFRVEEILHGQDKTVIRTVQFSERELRILRFALYRALMFL